VVHALLAPNPVREQPFAAAFTQVALDAGLPEREDCKGSTCGVAARDVTLELLVLLSQIRIERELAWVDLPSKGPAAVCVPLLDEPTDRPSPLLGFWSPRALMASVVVVTIDG
jgi:hypothetical protein